MTELRTPLVDHVTVDVTDLAASRRFYEAVLAPLGIALRHGPPGLRPQYHENYDVAYLLDPDGNNIEAVYRGASRRS